MLTKIKTRREFIRQSAITTVMLPFLFSCGQSSNPSYSLFDKDALKKFQKNFGGKIYLPHDPEYEPKRLAGFVNPELDKHPAIIAACRDEQDVLRSIEFAQLYQLEIAVRSGNHSFVGWGTVEKGMVIDLSQMKNITVDAGKKTCTVSSGATAAEILGKTAPYGLAPVLGECGAVGSGLVLGGGLGWLAGKYGATCDNLVKAGIVTADLQTLKADAETNKDLFWAIKGGGGNFGIVTSFEHQLHPVNEILGGSLSYPINKAHSILHFFNEFMTTAPDELQADCYITDTDCWVEFVYFGSLDKGELLFDQFRKFAKPKKDSVKRRLFSEVYSMESGGDFVIESYSSNKGCYVEQMSDEVISYVLECVSHPPDFSRVLFDFSHYMHGEVCRTSSDAAAFGLRRPNAAHLVFFITWQNSSDSAKIMAWLNEKLKKLQTYSGGRIYANYMSEQGGPRTAAVFGDNFQRLRQLKKKFDPNNVFHLNQNILPA